MNFLHKVQTKYSVQAAHDKVFIGNGEKSTPEEMEKAKKKGDTSAKILKEQGFGGMVRSTIPLIFRKV